MNPQLESDRELEEEIERWKLEEQQFRSQQHRDNISPVREPGAYPVGYGLPLLDVSPVVPSLAGTDDISETSGEDWGRRSDGSLGKTSGRYHALDGKRMASERGFPEPPFQQHHQHRHRHQQDHRRRAPSPPPPRPPQERTVEISPGVHVRLRGADETWKAIERDFYMPAECMACCSTIFCILDADYVLCPDCRVVSRMEGASTQGNGGVGLGFKYNDLSRWQEEILETRRTEERNRQQQQQQHSHYRSEPRDDYGNSSRW